MSINNTAQILFDGSSFFSNEVATEVDQQLTLTKTVDKAHVLSGGTLLYLITINNPNNYPVDLVDFKDEYDSDQTTYVLDSFQVNGVDVEPDNTDPIQYMIPTIPALSDMTIVFKVTVN